MKKIFLVALIFAIAGCASVAKQQRKAEQFYFEHPEKLALQCAQKFPPDTIFKAGETIVKSDTTFIKGDSIPCPPSVNEAGDTVYIKVKCPDARIIHDSIFKTDTLVKLDNARVAYLSFKNDSLNTNLIQTATQKNDALKTAANRLWWIIGLAAVAAGSIFINIKKLFV